MILAFFLLGIKVIWLNLFHTLAHIFMFCTRHNFTFFAADPIFLFIFRVTFFTFSKLNFVPVISFLFFYRPWLFCQIGTFIRFLTNARAPSLQIDLLTLFHRLGNYKILLLSSLPRGCAWAFSENKLHQCGETFERFLFFIGSGQGLVPDWSSAFTYPLGNFKFCAHHRGCVWAFDAEQTWYFERIFIFR